MALYGLKGVEDKTHIKCIDMDGKYLGELPSKYFKNEELAAIGVGSNTHNMGNAELKKVFKDKKSFDEFSLNVL
jgi:hypothetical protein